MKKQPRWGRRRGPGGRQGAAQQEMQGIESRRDTLEVTRTATTRPTTTGLRQSPTNKHNLLCGWEWLPRHKNSRFQSRLGAGRGLCAGAEAGCVDHGILTSPPFTGKNSLQNPKFLKQKHKVYLPEK